MSFSMRICSVYYLVNLALIAFFVPMCREVVNQPINQSNNQSINEHLHGIIARDDHPVVHQSCFECNYIFQYSATQHDTTRE